MVNRCDGCRVDMWACGASPMECRQCYAPICTECADYDVDYDANEESGGWVPSAICVPCLRERENSK